MVTIDLQKLVEHMGYFCRSALEAAAGAAVSRSHYNVEIEHWMLQALILQRSDIDMIFKRLHIDVGQVVAGLNATLDRLLTGNGRGPSLSPDLVAIGKNGWLIASLEFEQAKIRSGHLLCACVATESVAFRLFQAIPQLNELTFDSLRHSLAEFTRGSIEDEGVELEADGIDAQSTPSSKRGVPALERFTIDLTERARLGQIDPIVGRDDEIRQLVDILSRRRQNNPILTGEAGVGKTAIVEGLALRVAEGDVSPALTNVAICTLDLGRLQAGAGIKGEFESRLRSVIDECESSLQPVILFVDEAHTLIGAGNAPGQGDAANLLKPALARGELRVIAATTWAEYKEHIEKDAALARRFQAVKVDEPSDAVAMEMVRGLIPMLETHHHVRILDEAVASAVLLSRRYIPDRQLPDKAISLIDTACARVAMSQNATPPVIEEHRRRVAALEAERWLLRREEMSGSEHLGRLGALARETETVQTALRVDESHWAEERKLVKALVEARVVAEAADVNLANGEARAGAVSAALAVHALQGEQPMVFSVVDSQAVAAVVANWTGVPAGRMRSNMVEQVLGLEDALRQRVVGQDHALQAVAEAIRISRAGLTNTRKPVGVFLMVGTSGVGKTETAAALADILYGGAQSLMTINMTEFKEEHKVSLLMGSPPGYVGYGKGGLLTEAVRRRPHGVLLLDEFEKAHPSVQELFFQVFDKGTMKDSEGRDVDFRNTIVIMTTNAASNLIAQLFADEVTAPDPTGLAEVLQEELRKHFMPAFLGRLRTVPYLPLDRKTLTRIADLQLDKLTRSVQQRYSVKLDISTEIRGNLIDQARASHAGARSIEAKITRILLPPISDYFLRAMVQERKASSLELVLKGDNSIEAVPYFTL